MEYKKDVLEGMESSEKPYSPVKNAVLEKLADYIRHTSPLDMLYHTIAWGVILYTSTVAQSVGVSFLGSVVFLSFVWFRWKQLSAAFKKIKSWVSEHIPKFEKGRVDYFENIPLEDLIEYLESGEPFSRDVIVFRWGHLFYGNKRDKAQEIIDAFEQVGIIEKGEEGGRYLSTKYSEDIEQGKRLITILRASDTIGEMCGYFEGTPPNPFVIHKISGEPLLDAVANHIETIGEG